MWVMINDAFLSIVHKDCRRDELLVRARRQGDIQKVFPKAAVKRTTNTDYLFRAAVPREDVERAIAGEVRRINYSNFKDSVQDKPLHDAYLRVWNAMAELQPVKAFSTFKTPNLLYESGGVPRDSEIVRRTPRRAKKRSLKKGA